MKRLPHTLDLLPGLRWQGKLKILDKIGDHYCVAFDAVDADSSLNERIVYDRTVLSAELLKAWTGWSE